MSSSELVALQEWFAAECDGDWEHQQGLRIQTLDNPGWSVDIDLRDTALELSKLDEIAIERSDLDWVGCKVENATFRGRGGVRNLREILRIFLGWAERG